ncbi:MAG: hypothetical protein V8S97_03370 [Oscillospiraceae bacterium]
MTPNTSASRRRPAALDLRMAALGVKWDEAVQRAKEWQKQLEELEKQLRDLETDEAWPSWRTRYPPGS